MKQIDAIIRAEKEVDYRQRDKQLFSFYTLTLIAQENASRNLKKMLAIGLCLFSICVAFLISPMIIPDKVIEGSRTANHPWNRTPP